MGSHLEPILLACVLRAPFDAVRLLGDRPSVRGLIAVRMDAFVGPPPLGWIEEIPITDPHDFCGCYRAIADRLPLIVRAREISQRELVVDVSGAPQPLACAVTMAAAPFTTTMRFETNDDWPGAGDANPWEALALARFQGAVEAFDRCQWDVSIDRLSQLAALAPTYQAPFFAAFEDTGRAFRAWDRLLYTGVASQLTDAAFRLAQWQPPRRQRKLVDVVDMLRTCARRAERLEGGDKRALAADEVANADRRAGLERRYDDAALRLSSAVVMASTDPEFSLRHVTRPGNPAEEYDQIRAHVLRALKLREADVAAFPRLAEFDLTSLI